MSFVFDGFVVDPEGYRLLRQGREVTLEPRVFDLLHHLVKHRGRVVPKQELLEEVWGARTLSEGVLSNAMAKLRRALGQAPNSDTPIETIHGRGYCFRAELVQENREIDGGVGRAESRSGAAATDPFVGRDAVLEPLLLRLDGGYRGSENLVLLSGEAGIGKTRMARELAACARERGMLTWTGISHEGEGAPPYWPWIQILRAARQELPDAMWRGAMPPAAWALGQLVPELEIERAPPLEIEPQAARFQLFDAVSGFLACVASNRPLLLIIDDLHFCDAGSVELLGFAARALQGLPIMLLATLRTGESPVHHEGRSHIERLGRLATSVLLPGLSPEAVSELATALTGDAALDPTLMRALHGRTRGNPLFVRQALDLITVRGDWSFVHEPVPVADLPPAIRHVIRRRLDALADGTRGALEAAAVAGKRFELRMVADALEIGSERVLDALEPALAIGLLELCTDAPHEFAFAHVLVRDCLYEGLGMRRRGELHARIAAALEQRHSEPRSRHLGQIAEHRLHALPLDLARTVDACRKAAAAAKEASGFEAAAHLLTRAISKVDAEGYDTEMRFHLLLELGEDHFYAGLIGNAWKAFREAAEGVRAAGSFELLAEVAPRLVDCLEVGMGDAREVSALVERALAGLPESAAALRASLLAQQAELGVSLPARNRFELLDRAGELAQASAAPAAILEVAHSRAILRDPTCLPENANAARQFLELAECYPEAAAGMRYRSLRRFGAHLTLYLCALTGCDVNGADAALDACRSIADSSLVQAACFAVDLMQAGRALADRRLAELERLLIGLNQRVKNLERANDGQAGLEMAASSSYGAALLMARGRIDVLSGLEMDEQSVLADPASRHGPYFLIASAELYAATGRVDRARAAVARIPERVLERMPAQYGDLGALCSLAEVSRISNDRKAAERLYELLARHAHLNAVKPTFEYHGSVAHYLGVLARLLGRQSRAKDHFQLAIELNQRMNMRHATEESRRALAMPTWP